MTEFEDINFDEILDDGFSILSEEINLSNMEDSDDSNEQTIFPILPVRNMVMFPKIVIPITAGREMSIKLLEEAQKNNETIGILSQKNKRPISPT